MSRIEEIAEKWMEVCFDDVSAEEMERAIEEAVREAASVPLSPSVSAAILKHFGILKHSGLEQKP